MGKFVLFTGANGDTYFNLKAGNGEIILSARAIIHQECTQRHCLREKKCSG